MPKTHSRGLEPSGFTIRTIRFFHLCPMVTSFWRPRDFRIFTKNDHFLRHFFIFMHRNFIFRFFGASKMEGTFCLFLVYVAVVHTTPPTTPARTTEKRGHRWEYWVRACIALATHPGAMYFQARTRIPDRCQWSSNVRWGSLTEALTHFHARCRFWHRSDQKLCLP